MNKRPFIFIIVIIILFVVLNVMIPDVDFIIDLPNNTVNNLDIINNEIEKIENDKINNQEDSNDDEGAIDYDVDCGDLYDEKINPVHN